MRALHTTLTVALLSETFVAVWERSHVEQERSFKMGGGKVFICDGAGGCERTTEVSIARPRRYGHRYVTI